LDGGVSSCGTVEKGTLSKKDGGKPKRCIQLMNYNKEMCQYHYLLEIKRKNEGIVRLG
jgi:hypothetical protein